MTIDADIYNGMQVICFANLNLTAVAVLPTASTLTLNHPSRSMRNVIFVLAGLLILGGGGSQAQAQAQAQDQPAPLTGVHAHNDYDHKRPLFDALDQGFCSVEADVHLDAGQLLVAHGRSQTKPERTLQSLYLDPLQVRVKHNGGHVFPNGPEFILLIDIKGQWQTSYPVLRDILKSYPEMITCFRDGGKETHAVLVIITGDRSRQMFAGESVRYAALDGTLADLDSIESANLIPWISSNWRDTFKWRGVGPMPEPEKAKLDEVVAKAHKYARKVRFWNAPDQPVFWSELLAHKVDLINTDHLEEVRKFLTNRRSSP
ncbi:MAG: phosphatidylinositol-specific phospholipase C/glycerophosphodiester phosphodiesterase family protein [Verrucomicrobiota bacterium]